MDPAGGIGRSVDYFNRRYMELGADGYRLTLVGAAERCGELLRLTDGLRDIEPAALAERPELLTELRLACRPPLTKDRLAGLTGVPIKRIDALEAGDLPRRPSGMRKLRDVELPAIAAAASRWIDRDLAPWLDDGGAGRVDGGMEDRWAEVVSEREAASMGGAAVLDSLEADAYRTVDAAAKGLGLTHASPLDQEPGEVPEGFYRWHPEGVWDSLVPSLAVHRAGSPVVPVQVVQSGDWANALRRRKAYDALADEARDRGGARMVLVLDGLFGEPYVRSQEDTGKRIVWLWELAGRAAQPS